MKRVYIAGKLNDDACGYIKNMHRMIKWAELVRQAGFAVFVPGLDFLQGVIFGNWEYADYFDNSQAWLDASDAVFLVPGWETSAGTAREIKRAQAHGIPVFSDIVEMQKSLLDIH
jgi:hypothetical protein